MLSRGAPDRCDHRAPLTGSTWPLTTTGSSPIRDSSRRPPWPTISVTELVDTHLDLGDRPGRANIGDKLRTLVMSALAGGDRIDDADALRAGGTGQILGFAVKAASTLGTFLRSFSWGHLRQLDAVRPGAVWSTQAP